MGLLDLYAETADTAAPNPLPAAPRTLGERVGATLDATVAPGRYFNIAGARSDAWQRASDELARKEVEWEKKGEVDENGELVPLNYGHLQNYLSMWAGQALKYAKELGLTPAAAAQILRDARGEFPGGFRHPSADALDCLSVPKLRQLQKALAEALDEEDIIDAA